MYKSKSSSFKISAVISILSIVLLSLVFGTLAYFRVQVTANGIITIGSDINFIICDSAGTSKSSTVTITDLSSGTKNVNFNIKKTEGVNAKLRVYVAVSIEDENGNLQNMLNGTTAIVSVKMGTGTGYKWVNAGSEQEKLVEAGWRYLKTSDGSSDYKIDSNEIIIPVCPSITVNSNNPYITSGYKIIVSLTAEMLQYDNASWE